MGGEIYDLIIIGAGPAGITAAVYAARKRINFIVISKDIGGQATWSGDVENYTGYQFITGPELVDKFEKHLRKFNISIKENEEVISVKKQDDIIEVKTDKALYEGRSVIIASGKRSKELGVPGEEEFKNRGLTYCATCDGPLFSDKDVAIIGGGNSALDAALQLIKIAKNIYIINIEPQIVGDAVMKEKVERNDKIKIMNDAKVTSVLGSNMVTGIKVKTNGKKIQLDVQGVFIEIGLIPNSEFIEQINKNEFGEIEVNINNETSVEGIYAAGDVTTVPEKQIVIAAGEGAKATLSVFKYLLRKK